MRRTWVPQLSQHANHALQAEVDGAAPSEHALHPSRLTPAPADQQPEQYEVPLLNRPVRCRCCACSCFFVLALLACWTEHEQLSIGAGHTFWVLHSVSTD